MRVGPDSDYDGPRSSSFRDGLRNAAWFVVPFWIGVVVLLWWWLG